MYAFRSVILTGIFFLVSTRVDIAIASLHECSFPDGFLVATENKGKSFLHQSKVIVNVPDDGYSIFGYPETIALTFKVSYVDVIFNGHVVYAGPEVKSMQPIKVCHSLKGRVSGVAQRFTHSITFEYYYIEDCHVYVLPMVVKRISAVSSEMANEIYRLAESCINSAICSQVGKLYNQYNVESPNMIGIDQMPGLVSPETVEILRGEYYHANPFEIVISKIMDNGTKIFIEQVNATGQTRFNVPDIDTRFTRTIDNIVTEGHFEATNGTFSKGIEGILGYNRHYNPWHYNTTLSHEGLKFIITKDYFFNGLNIDYNYTLKYGDVTAKGHMMIYMDLVPFTATFSVDYTEMPCKTNLVDIKIKIFEEIKNSFTNAGNLKPLLETRIWLDKKASDDLAERIEQHLRDNINSLNPGLETFNCEKYRL